MVESLPACGRGDCVKDRKHDGHEQRECYIHKSDHNRKTVDSRTEEILPVNLPYVIRCYLPAEQSVPMRGIPPDGVESTRHHKERSGLQSRSRHISRMSEVVCNQRSGEREKRDAEKKPPVQQHEGIVRPLDIVKQVVVVHPDYQDRDKAVQERHERRPLAKKFSGEIRCTVNMRELQVEDKQRNGDGEHAITERLNATGLFLFGDHKTAMFVGDNMENSATFRNLGSLVWDRRSTKSP